MKNLRNLIIASILLMCGTAIGQTPQLPTTSTINNRGGTTFYEVLMDNVRREKEGLETDSFEEVLRKSDDIPPELKEEALSLYNEKMGSEDIGGTDD